MSVIILYIDYNYSNMFFITYIERPVLFWFRRNGGQVF